MGGSESPFAAHPHEQVGEVERDQRGAFASFVSPNSQSRYLGGYRANVNGEI